jgi:hypothetical protein
MTVNQTQDIKEAIKTSLDNFTQNFASHILNQVKEGGEAVLSIGQESVSVWCQIFPWTCGLTSQIKEKVNGQTFNVHFCVFGTCTIMPFYLILFSI